jgi:hypothetical protein
MQEALAFLVVNGHNPFGRGFAIGSDEACLHGVDTDELGRLKQHRKFSIEWLVNQQVLEPQEAYEWWDAVTGSTEPAPTHLCLCINLENGVHPIKHGWFFDLLFDRSSRPTPWPELKTGRLQQLFPDMFAFEWGWDLMSRASALQPPTFAQTMIALYHATYMWESNFRYFELTDVFAAMLIVGRSIDWPNSDAETRIGWKKAVAILSRFATFLPPSDSTARGVRAAEEAIPVFEQMSIVTLGDVAQVILKCGPSVGDALKALGFNMLGLEQSIDDQEPDSCLMSLRPGQSPFLARLWHLLDVSTDMDWASNFVNAIKIIDEPIMDDPESKIGLKQFEEYIQEAMCPVFWVSDTVFCVNMDPFLRCIYWFQPEQLFVNWSDDDPTMRPVEQEQWIYELYRWSIKRVKEEEGYCLTIPGFTRNNFNASVLKMPLMAQRKTIINRYAVSDL